MKRAYILMIIVVLIIVGVLFGIEKGLTSYLIENHEDEISSVDEIENLSGVYWMGFIVIGIFLVFYFSVRHERKKEKRRASLLKAVENDWTFR